MQELAQIGSTCNNFHLLCLTDESVAVVPVDFYQMRENVHALYAS